MRRRFAKKPAVLKNKANIYHMVSTHKKPFQYTVLWKSPRGHYTKALFMVNEIQYEIIVQRYVYSFPRIDYIDLRRYQERTPYPALSRKQVLFLEQQIMEETLLCNAQ